MELGGNSFEKLEFDKTPKSYPIKGRKSLVIVSSSKTFQNMTFSSQKTSKKAENLFALSHGREAGV